MTLDELLARLAAGLAVDPARGIALPGASAPVPFERAETALRDWLYATGYCRWTAPERPHPYVSGDAAFVAALSRVLAGATCWEAGWHVASRGPAAGEPGAPWVFASNGRLSVFVTDPADLDRPDAAPGEPVRLRLPCAREHRSPGFFYWVGPGGGVSREVPPVRFYLNVDPAGAPAFLAALFAALAPGVPRFDAKLANDPCLYGRVDPAVLYVAPADYPAARAAVLGLQAAPGVAWREGTPMFARAIARGVAVAESPAAVDGQPLESFGQHRCGLVARAVLGCLARDAFDPSAWQAAVDAAFRAAGVDPAAPHVQTLPADLLA